MVETNSIDDGMIKLKFATTANIGLESFTTTISALPDFARILIQKSSYCCAELNKFVEPACLDFHRSEHIASSSTTEFR